MLKCPKCKKLVDENLKECSECGYSFATESQKEVIAEAVDDNEKSGKTIEKDMDSDKKLQTDVMENVEKEKVEEPIEAVTENDEKNNTDSNSSKKKINKRSILEIVGGVALIALLGCTISINGKYNTLSQTYNDVSGELTKLKEENETLKSENTELTNANAELTSKNNELIDANAELTKENDELANGAKKQLVDIKNAYEKGEWQKVVDLTEKLHEKYNGSAEDTEAQKLAKTSQKKIDEANKAKAAEEAKGYETGITYNQLARTPDDYFGKKVKFYGKVLQVIEGDDSVQIRLAVNDDYDTVLLGEYSSSIVSSRVLEDDHITVYGTSVGTISYKSTMGGTITIPGVYIDKIDQ